MHTCIGGQPTSVLMRIRPEMQRVGMNARPDAVPRESADAVDLRACGKRRDSLTVDMGARIDAPGDPCDRSTLHRS
ncbi:hypothetical protein GCM10027416_25730 [Okibacterium endophyticum]